MKRNTDKCHVIVSGYKHQLGCAKVEIVKIWEKRDVKDLGVHIDNELKFDKRVLDICPKAGMMWLFSPYTDVP